ncbi:MAG: acyl carrier protein [Eubacterium sp.]|jgi:acyl carrier protein|nr:acyl carrier protein [Eubacterium sp.]
MLFDEVKEILVDQLGVSEDIIELKTSLYDDLDMDSLDAVDLAMTIEEQYSVEVPDEALENFKTVEDVVTFIESRID